MLPRMHMSVLRWSPALLLGVAVITSTSVAAAEDISVTAEERILAALDQITVVDFVEEPLSSVVEYFKKLHNLEIRVDTRALEQPCTGSDTPITKELRNVTLRSALNQILPDIDCAWIIKDEVLLITSPEEAALHVTPRVYDVREIVTSDDTNADGLRAFIPLMYAVIQTIEPKSWRENNGIGTIAPLEYAGARVLTVTQTRDVHGKLAEVLKALVEIGDKHGSNIHPVQTEMLLQPAAPADTAKRCAQTPEEEILAALDEITVAAFIEEPLSGVVEFYRKFHNIEIQIDTRALEDVNIGADTPVAMLLENVTLRSVLNLMLGDLDLAWTIQNEVLLITTPEELSHQLTPRVYDVGRIVTVRNKSGDIWLDFDPLIQTIQRAVEPESWTEFDGPGSIVPLQYGESGVLMVNQRRDIHERIAKLLGNLFKIADNCDDNSPPIREKNTK